MIQTGINRVNKDEFPIPKIVHLSYKSEEQILPEWKDVIPAWKKITGIMANALNPSISFLYIIS